MCGWIQLEVSKMDGYGGQFLEGTEKGTKSRELKERQRFFLRNKMERSQDGRRHPGEILLG